MALLWSQRQGREVGKTTSKVWFDRDGNWADSGTAVTADQYAAMGPAQQRAFAQRVGIEPTKGVPERVLLYPAVGQALPGESIDTRVSYGREPDGSRTFGHRPVAGQLFSDGRWKDTGTLVSADQAAAMSLSQQAMLGDNLQFGDPERVAFTIDRSRDDPALVQAHEKAPNTLITYQNFRMKPATALGMARLERKLEERFPGREVRLTSTTGGRHTDPNHRLGLAVDFVVLPLTRAESRVVEKMAWQTGFKPYNEYIHTSRFKTGDHMHVRLLQ